MRTRLTIALFIIIAAAASLVLLSRTLSDTEQPEGEAAAGASAEADSDQAAGGSPVLSGLTRGAVALSAEALNGDETLLSSFSADINGDALEDQISVVRTASSPYLSVALDIYDGDSNSYEWRSLIPLDVTQEQSFSCTVQDLIGDHTAAIVCQGFNGDGNAVLRAFLFASANGVGDPPFLRTIADVRGDGAVFVEQPERSSRYETLHATGQSAAIIVYASDPASPRGRLQMRYEWNRSAGVYTLSNTVRIGEDAIAAAEISEIYARGLDGVGEALSGLWYMPNTEGAEESPRVFFDYGEKEVIFYTDGNGELYSWTHSNLRYNGIYISLRNQEIQSIIRQVDVSFRGAHEISLRVQENVRTVATESASWNGTYQKLSAPAARSSGGEGEIKALLSGTASWAYSVGYSVEFDGDTYTAAGGGAREEGRCFFGESSGDFYVEFSPPLPLPMREEDGARSSLYRITYEVPEDGAEGAQGARFILEECRIEGDGVELTSSNPVILTPAS